MLVSGKAASLSVEAVSTRAPRLLSLVTTSVIMGLVLPSGRSSRQGVRVGTLAMGPCKRSAEENACVVV